MAENIENNGCSQRDNAEHEGYVKASRSFNRIWKERDSAQPRLLEAILYKDNFNRAYKRVKANKGAPGIDGMTIEEALPYLKEHQQEITDRIYRGKYTPSPVRRVEIPKPDGGVRKLGIPTVIDRTIQQAITQELVPIYEPLFADGSFGYRPGRSAKDAIQKVKEYAEQGYTYAVSLDLLKYFDTLNHEILLNLLRKNVKDERVVQLIKRYLKSGVMENGVVMETEEGSPQGGNLSPLLANIYLNEFDQEFLKRGVPCVRYADDIVLLAKSKRASERLLESSTKYLEEKLDTEKNFLSLFNAINKMAEKYDMPILYSCHPRSRKRIESTGFKLDPRVIQHEPLGFHDYNCLQMNAFAVVSDSGTLPEESSFFTSVGHPFPAICIRTSTERPEALDKACFILSGIDEKGLLQSVDTAVEMNKAGDYGIPVPDYIEENVSTKVVKIIQSYTGVVNKMVWRKDI